jgi:hypothetical protein
LKSQELILRSHCFNCQVKVFNSGLYVTLNTMFVTVVVGLVAAPGVPPPAGGLLLDELELGRA